MTRVREGVHLTGTIRRGDFTVTMDCSLAAGTVTAILGPNGAGKSTVLRAVAGLNPLETGSLVIDGRVVDDGGRTLVDPRHRSVGVVFQDYALFPHLTIRENVAFGPRSRGVGRAVARAAADRTLAGLGIDDLAGRRPRDISGGQAQRVALARALATEPAVLLLDEPMAALDVETRETVRVELDRQVTGFAGTTILVTHDPLDALLLADRVIVLEDGRVVQDERPADLARRPATSYVAALMGVTLLRGTARDGVLDIADGGSLRIADTGIAGPAAAVIRPESVSVHLSAPEGSARNAWPGTVASLQPSHDRVRVLVDGSPSVVATVTPGAVAELGLTRGTPVWLSVKAVDIEVHETSHPTRTPTPEH